MKTKLLILMALAGLSARVAKADYVLTWAGTSNLFQGSFEVTDAEMQPNQFFYPLSLTNSISITSPDGNLFHWDSSQSDVFAVASSSPNFLFGITFYDPQETPTGYLLEVHAEYNSFQEWGLMPGQNGTLLNSETGSWNVTYIPEPSVFALLGIGGAVLLISRCRSWGSSPRLRHSR